MPESVTNTNLETLSFPVWGTQGGGLARRNDGGLFVWYELPDWAGGHMHIGDPVPDEWDLAPANHLARSEMYDPGERTFVPSYPGEEFPVGTGEYVMPGYPTQRA